MITFIGVLILGAMGYIPVWSMIILCACLFFDND